MNKIDLVLSILGRGEGELEQAEYEDLVNYRRTPMTNTTEKRQELADRVKRYLEHVDWVRENKQVLASLGIQPSDRLSKSDSCPDGSISNFASLYSKSGQFKKSILVGLARAFVAKFTKRMNSTYAKNVVDFCQVVRLKSQEDYAVVKANLLSVSLRHLKRVVSQQQQRSPVVDPSFNGLALRMSNWFAPILESVEKDGGTKIPHHMIALSGIEDTDDIERQNRFLDIASEVKCAVMTVQNASPRYSPMKFIAARPQSTNESTPEFNTLLESAVKSNPRVRLLSMEFDGVSSEADYVRDMLVDF
ncbi:hypothetical protein PsorP6_015257 [Peronosclerospora sorghi]|uniref:Uncharacterized protein n=1 Tax=Peronosclerospora sorghi TaxID=230839 RepID=A0ACC0VSY5_9STRA|nr:hypothetical protein PsorP6_015257 [Peronosclerospora sorghi]